MPIWTSAQQNAIDARNHNILVSAAAGSGKTAVLVERVINLITDNVNPIDIDKLLIVTFTNAAAAEMRNRISKSLNELIEKDINNTNAIHQLSLLPNANISTIDSFCMNLVKENFFALDISQDFKILDDSEALLIENNAVNEIIESLYENNDEDFRNLVELLSSTKNDNELAETIKKVHSFIMSQPFPIQWLKSKIEMYNPQVNINDSKLKTYVYDEIRSIVSYVKSVINSSKIEISPDDDNSEDLMEIVESDYLLFDRIDKALSSDWDTLYDVVNNASFSTLTRKNNPAKEIVKSNREIYKTILAKDIAPLVSATSSDYKNDCEYLYPLLKSLCSVVELFNKKMFETKKEINSFSFSDIEHFAIDLLFYYKDGEIVRTELAKDYSNNFAEILVDEYQDTNTAQDTLFEMLSNGQNLFMVGDVKQSIYRFRLAMPQIFNHKKNTFSDYSSENNDKSQKIILDKNFRSRKGVCDYTNFIFSTLMTEKVGELDYTSQEYLNYGASYENTTVPSAQIKLIETPDDVDKDEYEAIQVAKMIKSKVLSKEKIKDDDKYREINYGDFAILFRATKSVLPKYTKVFKEFNIPVSSSNKINLFENNEVSILLSLLRVVDNPIQDVPLLATLMSVFYGYSADDIASARVNYESSNLYSSIVQDKTFSKFVEDLERYRKYASTMDVESFIRQIISDTSYMSIVSAMGDVEQRRQNIYKFIDIARSYDNTNSIGLTAFIRYIDSVISNKLNVESAEINQSSQNAVKMMSVHKSKGLEFPVCILANSSHQYNMMDLNNQIQINDELGIGLKVHNEEFMYRYKSIQYSVIRDTNRYAMMSENLRVLYVAITRAKEQFISVISLKGIENDVKKLSEKIVDNKISPYIIKHINNDADLILMSALLHKDAGSLRALCNKSFLPSPFNSSLSIDVLNSEIEDVNDKENVVEYSADLVEQIKKKLDYKYDRKELSGFISKRAASSLDEKDIGFEYFASSKPAFLQEGGLTASQKGTAMHTFMQYCDYDNANSNLDLEIERLVAMGYITDIYAASLNKAKLKKLFNSDFAKRIFCAKKLYREIKISSFVPVSEIEDTSFDDKILVQGIADCVFEENGELVLVDYKTDKVNSEEELLERYKRQIAFYKSALSKTLNMPVKEAILYSFSLDKCCIYK